jgi:hypothetical protein
MKTPFALAVLAPLLATVGFAASAQAAQPRDPAAGEVLFNRGRAAAARQNWQEACPAFEQSQALDPATGTLLNVGECHYQLRIVATAWQDFVEALRELSPTDPRRAFTESRIAELEKRIPRVAVRLAPEAPEGTTVTKNGVTMPPATMGLAVPIDPGTVTFVVTAPGRAPRTYTLELREGQSENLDVVPGPVERKADTDHARVRTPAHDAPASPPPNEGSSALRPVGFTFIGIGIAGLAAGGVTGGLALSRAATYRTTCGPSLACQDPGQLATANAAAADAKNFATASTISLIAGGALFVTGLIFVLSHPSRAVTATAASIRIDPRSGTGVWELSF